MNFNNQDLKTFINQEDNNTIKSGKNLDEIRSFFVTKMMDQIIVHAKRKLCMQVSVSTLL